MNKPVKLKRWLWRSATAVILCGLLWTGYVQWHIQHVDDRFHTGTYDTAIVLGAALWDDAPSPALRERLDWALRLYREGRFAHFIVTGGLDRNGSTLSEGEGMARYLISQGVPESAIVIEPEASNTIDNLLFSQRLMAQHGWHSAVIVTHRYHGARALDMARYLHYENPALALTDSQVMWMPYHNVRETLAYTKWKLVKWFGLV